MKKLTEHLEHQSETERLRRVNLDAALAKGAAREDDGEMRKIFEDLVEMTRGERNELLARWKLSEDQMARVEELQLKHWWLQHLSTKADFLARPSAIGDRSDLKRVEAHESEVRRASASEKQVFRLLLLPVLGSPHYVEEYLLHEEKMVDKIARDARGASDAAMGEATPQD